MRLEISQCISNGQLLSLDETILAALREHGLHHHPMEAFLVTHRECQRPRQAARIEATSSDITQGYLSLSLSIAILHLSNAF